MKIMLTCRELAEQADAFLDKDISFARRQQVRLHMSMCKGCARFVNQMRVTRGLITAEANREQESEDDIKVDMHIDRILDALNYNNDQTAELSHTSYEGSKK